MRCERCRSDNRKIASSVRTAALRLSPNVRDVVLERAGRGFVWRMRRSARLSRNTCHDALESESQKLKSPFKGTRGRVAISRSAQFNPEHGGILDGQARR
jgi:hypothetical protein